MYAEPLKRANPSQERSARTTGEGIEAGTLACLPLRVAIDTFRAAQARLIAFVLGCSTITASANAIAIITAIASGIARFVVIPRDSS